MKYSVFIASNTDNNVLDSVMRKNNITADKVAKLEEGKEDEAIEAFTAAGDFSDSKAKICSIYYDRAVSELAAGEYDAASSSFATAADYVDDATPTEYSDAEARIKEPYYQQAKKLVAEKKTVEAMAAFYKADGFSDAKEQYIQLCIAEAERIKSEEGTDRAIAWLKENANYQEITDRCTAETREAGVTAMNNKDYTSAIAYFSEIEDEDMSVLIAECHYHLAEQYEEAKDPAAAIEEYTSAGDYTNAAEKVVTVCLNEANRLKAEGNTEAAIEWLSKYKSDAQIKEEYQKTVYDYAKQLLQKKESDKALKYFESIKGYSDVNTLLDSDPQLQRAKRRKLKDTPIGGTITFGHYEQDNHSNNGKEPIEWRVLSKDGDKLLLISKKVLDSHYFHTRTTFKTWDKSNVRDWLNSTFMNDAFTKEEQEAIALSLVKADDNTTISSLDSGLDTRDKVFLLSSAEVKKYFKSDKDMEAEATTYAAYQGGSWLGKTLWMTRTPCLGTSAPACVFADSGIMDTDVLYSTFYMSPTGVRPAIWLDFSSKYYSD